MTIRAKSLRQIESGELLERADVISRCSRSIMDRHLPRAHRHGALAPGPCSSTGWPPRAASRSGLEIGPGRSTRGLARQIEDGGLEPDRRRSAIDHQVDLAVEIGERRARPGSVRCGSTGLRSAPRSGWPTRSMRPRATAPAGARKPTVSLPAVTRSGMIGVRASDERERAGPEARSQALCVARANPRALACLRDARNVNDERVDRGPSLGREDPRDRRGLRGDRSQAVDRLGRECDQPAALQDLRRQIERGGIGIGGVDDDDARSRQRDTMTRSTGIDELGTRLSSGQEWRSRTPGCLSVCRSLSSYSSRIVS